MSAARSAGIRGTGYWAGMSLSIYSFIIDAAYSFIMLYILFCMTLYWLGVRGDEWGAQQS